MAEHCSYKSSRIHLGRLPTEGAHVLVGPGENAGVIDAGDGIAIAVRIESHNHPSAIEPHQGAATGVGGILRDIFTMGARPLCVMDPLFFGELDHPRQRWLFDGVVRGHLGLRQLGRGPNGRRRADLRRLLRGQPARERALHGGPPRRAAGPRHRERRREPRRPARRRDGARRDRRGVVLASAGFGAAGVDDDKRPSVQVGDPYEEKRLIEACLELLDAGLVVGIQDLGGAGLACATSETAARAGLGMDVDVLAVPRRESTMVPAEVMTSESQERMLAIVAPSHLDAALSGVRALGGGGDRGRARHRARRGGRRRARRAAARARRARRADPRRRARCRPRRRGPPLRPAAAAPRRPRRAAR